MARVAERSQLSPEEYLAWERQQERKPEYFEGEVYAMASGSPRHNRLSSKVTAALGDRARGPLPARSYHQRINGSAPDLQSQ